jgi:hypothetical protein
MIKSHEELADSVRNIPELNSVPDEVVTKFRENLRFAGGGLAHSDYSMLEGHVNDNDLPRLFEHFGIDATKFESIRDTSCVDHVCFVHPRAFCDPDRCEH